MKTIYRTVLFLAFGFSDTKAQTPFFNVLNNYNFTNSQQLVADKIVYDSTNSNSYLFELQSISSYVIGNKLTIEIPGMEGNHEFWSKCVLSNSPDDYYWAGYNADGSAIALYKSSRGLLGTIFIAPTNTRFGISILSPELSFLVKKTVDFNDRGCSTTEEEPSDSLSKAVLMPESCSGKKIRILFFFTQAALDNTGEDMVALGHYVINQLNSSVLDSGLSTYFDIGFEAVDDAALLSEFTEENTAPKTSRKLRDWPAAKALRQQKKADIVSLFCDNIWTNNIILTSASGHAFNNADASNAFVTAQTSHVKFYYKTTHGIGHIIGADHQLCTNCCDKRCHSECDDEGGLFDCNLQPWTWKAKCQTDHGYKFQTIPVKTIMTDCEGERIGLWSNPDNIYSFQTPQSQYSVISETTGTTHANNADELRKNASYVACFQPEPNDPQLNCEQIPINGANYVCNDGYIPLSTTHVSEWFYSINGIDFISLNIIGATADVYSLPSWLSGTFVYIKVIAITGNFCGIKIVKVATCINNPSGSTDRSTQDYEPLNENKIGIFPNPTSNSFQIPDIITGQVNIRSANGVVLINSIVSDKTSIDVSTLLPGLYFVEIVQNNNRQFKLLIKI